MGRVHTLRGATVLVTGGCGFIGGRLVRLLLERGAGEVRVVDDQRCGDPSDLAEVRDRVQLSPLSLGDADPAELAPLLDGVEFLFHLAAEKASHPQTDDAGMLRGNVKGTHDLYEQAARAGVKKIVFASSVMAYGRRAGQPLIESEAARPDTIYGASKLAGENLTAACGRRHGIEWNALRYFFVYGPRQFEGRGYRSVIVRTARRLLAGEAPEIYGDGEQVFDYVFIDDVAEASLLALEAPVSGAVLNVGSGRGVRIKDLIARISTIAQSDLAPTSRPADATAGSSRVADVSQIREVLGWRPATALDEGLRRTYAWLAEERTAL